MEKHLEKEITAIIEEHRSSPIWPKEFERKFGTGAALSFFIGIEELQCEADEALIELEDMSEESLLEDTGTVLDCWLPPCFEDRYDAGFVRKFLERVTWWKENPGELKFGCAHTVVDEIILTIAQDCGKDWIKTMLVDYPSLDKILYPEDEHDEEPDDESYNADYWGWAYDLFDDADVAWLWDHPAFVENPLVAIEGTTYHFDHWFEPQFYLCNQQDQPPTTAGGESVTRPN